MSPRPVGAWLMVAAGLAVLASLAATVAVIGTPARQRLARLDERRVEDIDALHDAIEVHARGPRGLPATLADLDAPARARRDPATGRAYRYDRRDTERYRLCADFALATPADRIRAGHADAGMHHPAGPHCFTYRRGVGRAGH